MPTSHRLPSIRPTTRRERIKRNETTIHKNDIFSDKIIRLLIEVDKFLKDCLREFLI